MIFGLEPDDFRFFDEFRRGGFETRFGALLLPASQAGGGKRLSVDSNNGDVNISFE